MFSSEGKRSPPLLSLETCKIIALAATHLLNFSKLDRAWRNSRAAHSPLNLLLSCKYHILSTQSLQEPRNCNPDSYCQVLSRISHGSYELKNNSERILALGTGSSAINRTHDVFPLQIFSCVTKLNSPSMSKNINTISLCLQNLQSQCYSDLFLSINLIVTGLVLTEIVQEMKNEERAGRQNNTHYKCLVFVENPAKIKKKNKKGFFIILLNSKQKTSILDPCTHLASSADT